MFKLIDLTRPLSPETLSYPGSSKALGIAQIDMGDPECMVSQLTHLDLHAGTHMDAPLHFAPGGKGLLDLGLQLLPVVIVRVQGAEIGANQIPSEIAGSAVLFDCRWPHETSDPNYFLEYPTLTESAAQALIDRQAALAGFDTPSPDPVSPPDYRTHRMLLRAGIPIVEGLTNLSTLPDDGQGIWFAAFPLAVAGVEGASVRAVVLQPRK